MIVIAKQPVPGRVKTRLAPALGYVGAAAVAAAALADTLRVAATVPAARYLLALDGQPGEWIPPGWDVVAQRGHGLDERLGHAFAAAGPGPAVLIGMDTPQLHADQLSTYDPTGHDACLGLATDGGYWAIGLADPSRAPELIAGVPMSTSRTGAVQLERLRAAGLRVQLLETLTDVDTIDVARAVAGRWPATEFARALRSLDDQANNHGALDDRAQAKSLAIPA